MQDIPTNKPQGFPTPSLSEWNRSFIDALKKDHGERRNVVAHLNKLHFTVREERDFTPSKNTSIQQVSWGLISDWQGHHASKASLISENEVKNNTDILIGSSDGKVTLSVGLRYRRKTFDITKAAAEAGITAAGIRQTQKDIAWDGEVERCEQVEIIGMIRRAKVLAGIK